MAPVFAATYKIVSYDFLVTGKTRVTSLGEVVGPTGVSFETFGEMAQFLDERRQELINMRLFSDVDYKYEVASEYPVGFFNIKVTFYIFDANSIFVLPYPKYDSNYGFKIGLKVYNRNVGGEFTNLYSYFGYSQQNNKFSDGVFDWELALDDIKLGSAEGSVSNTGVIDLLHWDKSFLSFAVGVEKIEIKDFEAAASLSFKFAPEGKSREDQWGFSELCGTFNFKFNNGTLDNFSFYNSVKSLPLRNELDTSTRMSYRMGYDIYSQTVFKTIMIDDPENVSREFDYIELGTGISKVFPLTQKINMNTSFMFFVQYDYDANLVTSYFDLGFTSSYDGVDWEGNFRRGINYNFGFDLISFPINEIDRNSFKMNGRVSAFIPVTSWFNPSARATFMVSDRTQYFVNSSAVADYARGIRLNNEIVDTDIVSMRKFTLALNLDLMMNFVTIKDFCHSYAIPFADLIVASKGNYGQGFDYLWTVGADGVVILDSHPSYPIRGSVGFNGKDLISLAKGEIGLSDLEFEIFIGMGFFY